MRSEGGRIVAPISRAGELRVGHDEAHRRRVGGQVRRGGRRGGGRAGRLGVGVIARPTSRGHAVSVIFVVVFILTAALAVLILVVSHLRGSSEATTTTILVIVVATCES